MIYSSSEVIQLLVLGACFALTLIRALRMRNATWTEVACFFACMFLGNVPNVKQFFLRAVSAFTFASVI